MVLSRGVVCSANEASEDPPSGISNVAVVLLSTSMITVYTLPEHSGERGKFDGNYCSHIFCLKARPNANSTN